MAELFFFQNGVNANKSAYGHGIQFINVLEVITYSTLTEARIPGRVALSTQVINAFAVHPGDILFNRTSETQEEVGLASVYVGSAAVVFGGFVIRATPRTNSMDPLFSSYLMRSPVIRKQIVARGQGAVRANIGQQELSRVQVFIPKIAEQVAIVNVLSDADAMIESLEKLLTKKRHLKQGAIQELLRPKGRWLSTKLGSLGVFMKGSGVRKDESRSGDIPCIRYGELYTKHHDCIRAFHSWISSTVAASATRLKPGDVLFAGSGETKTEIGKCVAFIGDVAAYAGGDIVILRPEGVDSLFLGYYLNTGPINRQKASRGQGDAVVHISSSALSEIELTLPPVSEQTAIATVLSDMDAEIATLETKVAKVRQLKQGMMQELLTGRIRLI